MALTARCYLCGREICKRGTKNHILHSHMSAAGNQKCSLLKIEGFYNKDYWLYIVLRSIWLECCDHVSYFQNAKMETKINSFSFKDHIIHEYDMGNTTTTLITFVGTTWRKMQRASVRLLARNIPPRFQCAECSAAAEYICKKGPVDKFNLPYCSSCAENYRREQEYEYYFLPITNSPRMGVCNYCGVNDTFGFVPHKDGK